MLFIFLLVNGNTNLCALSLSGISLKKLRSKDQISFCYFLYHLTGDDTDIVKYLSLPLLQKDQEQEEITSNHNYSRIEVKKKKRHHYLS